jgi:hypothetical protein
MLVRADVFNSDTDYYCFVMYAYTIPGLHQYIVGTQLTLRPYGNWEELVFRYGYKLGFVVVQNVPAFSSFRWWLLLPVTMITVITTDSRFNMDCECGNPSDIHGNDYCIVRVGGNNDHQCTSVGGTDTGSSTYENKCS